MTKRKRARSFKDYRGGKFFRRFSAQIRSGSLLASWTLHSFAIFNLFSFKHFFALESEANIVQGIEGVLSGAVVFVLYALHWYFLFPNARSCIPFAAADRRRRTPCGEEKMQSGRQTFQIVSWSSSTFSYCWLGSFKCAPALRLPPLLVFV